MTRPSRFNNNPSANWDQAGGSSSTRVTGPTSALTSFLKEQGIRPRNVNRFTRTEPQAVASSSTADVAGPSTIHEEPEPPAEDIDSDDLDGDPAVPRPSPNKPEGEALPPVDERNDLKIQIPARSHPKQPSPDLDYVPKPKAGKYADRKPGFIAICEPCGKKFTVTPYTKSAQGGGQLCDGCAREKDSKVVNNTKQPPKKKRKTLAGPKVRQPWTDDRIQSLQMACINVIASRIHSLPASVVVVGSAHLDKISDIVCKHRELRPVNLPLFLNVTCTDLKLADCIHLTKDSLLTIPIFCPRLERLNLGLCGHMDGEVLVTYVKRLTKLRELDLFGAYLIRREGWLEAFDILNTPRVLDSCSDADDQTDDQDKMPSRENGEDVQGERLTTFKLKQAPRFDLDCTRALVSTCKNLFHLQLEDMSLFDDNHLDIIGSSGLKNLRSLSIANAGILNGITGRSLTDDGVLRLLKSVGSTLEVLDISQNTKLTDLVLVEGIGAHCRRLHSLNLSGLGQVTTAGVSELFALLKQAGASPLDDINLARCVKVGNEGLFSILDQSAGALRKLNLNSVDELRSEALERLAGEAFNIIELDVSFVRDVDDFTVKAFLAGMPNLKKLLVYGNNRVSDLCPKRKGLVIEGQERTIVVL